MNDNDFKALYERYKNSKFRQQKMDGWRPMPTISCITIIFVSIGIFFVLIGIIMLILIAHMYSIKQRYDNTCYGVPQGKKCYIELSIKKNMKAPIWIFYQIDGIRQDLNDPYLYKVVGKNIEITNAFDDNFTDFKISGVNIENKNIDFSKQDYSYINPFPNPRKYWGELEVKGGRIDSSKKLSLNIIMGQYNNTLGIKKYIIVTEKNFFGGRSFVLGIFCVVFGLLCLAASIIFINAYNNFHKRI